MDETQRSVDEGATSLFLAVEARKWRDALEILENDTLSQAATWIYTENWRRLPLHEACRRQAPTWIVAALIAAYPAAVAARTQFGELPLHLAVGCSATPEVVNLLLVSHWQGIGAVDQFGRKPCEILEESEIRDVMEHKTVLESLERSQESWNAIEKEHQSVLEVLQKQHQEEMKLFQARYDADLARKQSEVLALLERITLLEKKSPEDVAMEVTLAKKIEDHDSEKMTWSEEENRLNRRILKLQEEHAEAINAREEMERVIEQQREKIKANHRKQQELKKALEHTASYAQRDLQLRIQATQSSLEKLYETFVDLEATADQHENELVAKLHRFGIKPLSEEEKKNDPDQDDEEDDDRMAAEILAAASSVLYTKKRNTFAC